MSSKNNITKTDEREKCFVSNDLPQASQNENDDRNME